MQRRLPERWSGVIEGLRFVHPRKSTEKTLSVGTVERRKNFISENDRSHILECYKKLNLTMRRTWNVLRKNFNWNAFKLYKPWVLKHYERSGAARSDEAGSIAERNGEVPVLTHYERSGDRRQ